MAVLCFDTDLLSRTLRTQQEEVYSYFFKWDGIEGSDFNFIFSATYGTEMPFLFGRDTDIFGGASFNPDNDTPGRQALSEAIMKYAKNFAYKGNPNSNCLPEWNKWSNEEGADKSITFDATEIEVDINMITEEITREDLDAKFWELYFSLPEGTGKAMWFVKWY